MTDPSAPNRRKPAAYKRRVAFAETDMAGMVHFSVFFRYMEEAEHAVWRAAGLRIAEPGFGVSWPRISAQCDFKHPLRVDDEFEVRTEMATVTARTIQWSHTLVRGDTVVAVGSVTTVCVKKHADGSMKAVEIPAELLARLRMTADC